MSLLFKVLYAAHAKGTHHKLALDGLQQLSGADAEAWQRVFLKHAGLLMVGAKAPDDEFKDFKNHVLHVRDNFWGGAPEKTRAWYLHLVEALRMADWSTAAYCAGVLSHYLTDPLHPFHTAQSEAENNIHRACEWSINRAYDDLHKLGAALPPPQVTASDAPNWLEILVCEGAQRSNRDYEKLIAHYDITRGVTDPPTGLDPISQKLVAELIAVASATFAIVLRRAIDEAAVAPPAVSLTLETVLATLKMPIKALAKKMADAEERRLVTAMYDELKATGTVEANLPEDDRMVRDLHRAEVLAKQPVVSPAALFPFRAPEKVETSVERSQRLKAEATERAKAAAAEKIAARNKQEAKLVLPQPAAAASQQSSVPQVPKPVSLVARLDAHVPPPQPAPAEPRSPREPYLMLASDIVDAPSIGPRTAERLAPHGIRTVGDLLAADPQDLAVRLRNRHITAATLVDWQDQARLVITVPGLRGTHAQLLVGAGLRTQEAIAEAEPADLCAKVLAYAATTDGQRLLRNGDPPDIERIKGWVALAQEAMAA